LLTFTSFLCEVEPSPTAKLTKKRKSLIPGEEWIPRRNQYLGGISSSRGINA
jgi:hypothetical protein